MSGKNRAPAFRRDRCGVEGLPLTLLVTMAVLAITVPLVFGSLRTYDRDRAEAALVSEIDNFISAVQLVYTSGPGNSVVVDFAASPGSITGVDHVIFGDEPGGNMSSVVRYKVQGRSESLAVIESPNVPMMSVDGTGFTIHSGNHRIRVECRAWYESAAGPVMGTHVVLDIIH